MNLRYFSEDQFKAICAEKAPSHVAIIPDGNRRWAKNRSLNPSKGHEEGASSLVDIVCSAKDLGVKNVSFYLFSTENWSRPQDEVDALMLLLHLFLIEQRPVMLREGIRVQTIGDISKLPSYVIQTINESKKATEHCKTINMVLALNYGARDELRRAMKSLGEQVATGTLSPNDITEEKIGNFLDTSPYGDPELLIRTSGELRLSNFMLWQLSYAEIYVTDVLWPDFRPVHLYQAILSYQQRERRLGGL